MTGPVFTVPATGVYTDSLTDRQSQFFVDDVIPLETAYRFGMPGAATVDDHVITATVDGTGAGQIPDGGGQFTVVSENADYIVTLPAPQFGQVVRLLNGITAYELRTDDPEFVYLNGGADVEAESRIAPESFVECRMVSLDKWICRQTANTGLETAVEVAEP